MDISKLENELADTELKVSVIYELMSDALRPMFDCFKCKGILSVYAVESGGDIDKAGRLWMERCYDALQSICTAAEVLARDVINDFPSTYALKETREQPEDISVARL